MSYLHLIFFVKNNQNDLTYFILTYSCLDFSATDIDSKLPFKEIYLKMSSRHICNVNTLSNVEIVIKNKVKF
jgi:hypothetical protein